MEDLVLSCLESRIEENRNLYARFLVGPFLKGDALTVATALRRVLLSSMESIAITALYIQGITHEFSTIVGIRESVLELSLNFQSIVLSYDKDFFQKKSFFEDFQIGYLQVQGPKIVYANDLKLPLGVKVVYPTQYVATLSREGVLVLKFTIGKINNRLGTSVPTQNASSDISQSDSTKQVIHHPVFGELIKNNIVKTKRRYSYKSSYSINRTRKQGTFARSCRVSSSNRKIVSQKTSILDFYEAKNKIKPNLKRFIDRSPTSRNLFSFKYLKDRLVKKFGSHELSPESLYHFKVKLNSGSALCTSYNLGFWVSAEASTLGTNVRASEKSQHERAKRLQIEYLYRKPAKINRLSSEAGVINTTKINNSFFTKQSPVKLWRFKQYRTNTIKSKTTKILYLERPLLYLLKPKIDLSAVHTRIKAIDRLKMMYKSKVFMFHDNFRFFYKSTYKNRSFALVKLDPSGQIFPCKPSFYSYTNRSNLCSIAGERPLERSKLLGDSSFVHSQVRTLVPSAECRVKKDIKRNDKVFKSDMCLRNIIPLDFTLPPVLKVNFVIEIDDEVLYMRQKVRERIILEVWTNGSIHPRQAVHDATLSLLDIFSSFRSLYQVNLYSSISSASPKAEMKIGFPLELNKSTFGEADDKYKYKYKSKICKKICKKICTCKAEIQKPLLRIPKYIKNFKTQFISAKLKFKRRQIQIASKAFFRLPGTRHECANGQILRKLRFVPDLYIGNTKAEFVPNKGPSGRDILPFVIKDSASLKVQGDFARSMCRVRKDNPFFKVQKPKQTKVNYSQNNKLPQVKGLSMKKNAIDSESLLNSSFTGTSTSTSTNQRFVKRFVKRFVQAEIKQKKNYYLVYKTKLEKDTFLFSDLGEIALPLNIYRILKEKGIEKLSTLQNISSFDLLHLLGGDKKMFYNVKRICSTTRIV